MTNKQKLTSEQGINEFNKVISDPNYPISCQAFESVGLPFEAFLRWCHASDTIKVKCAKSLTK